MKGPNEHYDYICKTTTNVRIIGSDEQVAYDSSAESERGFDSHRGIAPMFLQSLEDTESEEGEELELKCQIMGAPIPEVACFFAKNITEKTSIKRIRSELLDYNYETGIFKITIKNVTNERKIFFRLIISIIP